MQDKTLIADILSKAQLENAPRIQNVRVDDQVYWIKSYAQSDRIGMKFLHKTIGMLPLPVWIKPTPDANATGRLSRELRKIAAFDQAGFPTCAIVGSTQTLIVSSDAGATLDIKLKTLREAGDNQAHDSLILNAAASLGKVHGAGLCHGRPHLRDMFLRDGEVGFLDFEEEPESAMPLAYAQARDCWLFMLFATPLLIKSDAREALWSNYSAHAPQQIMQPLREIYTFWHRFAAPLRLLGSQGIGSDMKRIFKTDKLLEEVFRKNN